MLRPLTLIALTLTLLAPARAEEPERRDLRRVDPSRQVDLPFAHLKLREGLRLTEGPRSLRDAFPYLAVAPETVSSTNATALKPTNLGRFLVQAPQEGGHVPAAIRTGPEAIEAARLFVAGPLVTTQEAADRILAAARGLSPDLEAVTVRVTDHRPEAWGPRATALPQDRSIHPTEAWEVSLVALEMDRRLQLVHVTARVRADGTVEPTREALVEGPWTTWQSEGEPTEEERRLDALRRTEVDAVRAGFAQALDAPCDLDTVWAVARADPRWGAARLWLGEPDRDVGSGIRIHVYDLKDGGAALLGEVGEPLIYALWSDPVDRALGGGEVRRRLYAGPSR